MRRRPSKHVRRVRTKNGRKAVVVNRKIKKRRVRKFRGVVVPPGWKDVKFYDRENFCVTGVDEKGRLQYLYPQKFVEKSSKRKHVRVSKLSKRVPAVMKRVGHDVSKGLTEAEVVYTIYRTGFRPGSDRDTMADKKSFGAVTLEKRHVKLLPGDKVGFDFVGKKGVRIRKDVKDKRLRNIMKNRLKTKRVFNTTDGRVRTYFKQKAGKDFSIKDLRTLRASTVAQKVKGKDRKEIGRVVSEELGNTPAIALKSYVDPKLVSQNG